MPPAIATMIRRRPVPLSTASTTIASACPKVGSSTKGHSCRRSRLEEVYPPHGPFVTAPVGPACNLAFVRGTSRVKGSGDRRRSGPPICPRSIAE